MSFSLILFTYNQEKFVSEAVKAALSQKCDPIEILITDDCSNDKTFDIIQDAVKHYKGPHKVLLNRNNKNLGLSRHIDKAHGLSSGEVIIGAAGDDISHLNRCQKIIDCFESKSPLLVFSYADVIDSNGQETYHEYSNATLYKSNDIMEIASSGALYLGATGAWHRDLYEKYGSIEDNAYEDLVFGFRAAIEDKFYALNERLVSYRLGHGVTNSKLKFKTVPSFRKSRLKNLKVIKAVFRQRHKDALTFGYSKNSMLVKNLRKNFLKADIGVKYYAARPNELWKLLFKHPILLIKNFLLENMRLIRYKVKINSDK